MGRTVTQNEDEFSQGRSARARQKKLKRRRRILGGAAVALLMLAGALVVYWPEKTPIKGNLHILPPQGVSDNEKPLDQLPDEDEITAEVSPMERALQARGVYVTMDVFGTTSQFTRVVKFVREHPGLNCFVVDVKDNNGRIPQVPRGDFEIPSKSAGYAHFSALVNVLTQEDYYMIARIVAFQDPYMAKAHPEQAIRNADGSLWKDRDGRLWLNPYDERNWEFVRDVALWACEMGFDEIQLDYVRFPDSARGLEKSGVLMPGHEKYDSRGDAIADFLKYMKEELEGKAFLSADVFGFVTIAKDDMGIGQNLEQLASTVDFISPMVYPSHYYNSGIYGFEVPEAHPSEVVYKAIYEAIERTEGLDCKIRPWLQDFSMRIEYGPEQVQGQIDAVYQHGIETFMLWNPSNVYTEGVIYTKADAAND